MESEKRIDLIKEFLEDYKGKIENKINRGKNHLVLSFRDLIHFDSDIAEFFLDNPEDFLDIVETVIKDEFNTKLSFKIRIKSVLSDQKKRIRDIRSLDIGKFVSLEGYVKAKSDVRPRITSTKYECPSCGNIISILQTDTSLKEPGNCSCGRKGKFKLLSKELIDGFTVVLEESPDIVKYGTELKRINVFINSDLTETKIEDRIYPGVRLRINGVLKDFLKKERTGGKSTSLDIFLEANYIKFLETSIEDITISEEDKILIEKLSKKKDVLMRLSNILFKGVQGHEQIKESIILQAFGGVTLKNMAVPRRGQIHILLIGDPGSGKSTMLLLCRNFLPKCRYAAGQGASGRGLTASVVRDELLGGFRVEAGMLALTHEGVALIDEMDKIREEDRYAIHEPLEQGTITVDKADIHATLKSETSILAAANPKMGRFDPYKDIYSQIDFEPTLVNRFDLVFPLKDKVDEEQDSKTAMKILTDESKEEDIDSDLVKKYIAYAKRINPKIPKNLAKKITQKYVEIRKSDPEGNTFPITTRQVAAIRRLTEAHARMKLREVPKDEDVNFAIGLIQYNLRQIGLDPETGQVDVDKITLGITHSERTKFEKVIEAIEILEEDFGKQIPIEELIDKTKEQKITETETEMLLEKLMRRGDIFEPKRGFVQKI